MLLDLVYLTGAILGAPVVLWLLIAKPRVRVGGLERFGLRLPRRPGGDRPLVWVHGVSVGEVMAAGPLIAALEETLPGYEIAISTTTGTGFEVARKRYPTRAVFFYPLDLSFAVRRVLRAMRPSLIVLVELEIWPNFLKQAARHGVPVVLVNGRISERSLRGYSAVRWLLRGPLERIAAYCVQTQTYRDRFLQLGVPEAKLSVTGTMKYDALSVLAPEGGTRERVRAALGVAPGAPLVVAGSTHPGEEAMVVRAWLALREAHPGLRLCVVPRHNERAGALTQELSRLGVSPVRKTSLDAMTPAERAALEGTDRVVLGDTMGELVGIYEAADVVFVGGSLVPSGGQNMIEPCGLGRPVLFGPHTMNFRASVEELLASDAARVVDDEDALLGALGELLGDPDAAADMGARARATIEGHRGAAARTVRVIERVLRGGAASEAKAEAEAEGAPDVARSGALSQGA